MDFKLLNRFILLLVTAMVYGCGSGGEESGPVGWVTITDPTSENTYTTSDIHSILLSGESFVSPNAEMIEYTRCNCVGLGCLLQGAYCEKVSYFDTKVTLTVVNETTGDIGELNVRTEFELASSVWTIDIPVFQGDNIIKVTAVDDIGNSGQSEIKIIVNDTISPTIPGGVFVETDPGNNFYISWRHSSDNYKVDRYKIYRDDLFIKEMVVSDALLDAEYLQIHDPDATQGLLHCYHITAHDGDGNISPESLKSCASSSTYSTIDSHRGDYYAPPSALALDGNGYAHIAYAIMDCDSGPCITGPIKYAHNILGNWEIITIKEGSGYHPTPNLTIDDTGYAHIIFCLDGLYYLTNQSGIWVETRHNMFCNNPDIYRDNAGKIHSVIVDGILSQPNELRYVPDINNLTYGYRISNLGTTAKLGKVELDSQGYAHIAYHDAGQVWYTTNKSGDWKRTLIASMSNDYYPYFDLAIDSLDNPHIFYRDIDDRLLKRTQLLDGQWQIYDIDMVKAGSGTVSLSIDEQDQFHVTYGGYDYFYYSTNVSGKWETFDIGYKWEYAGNLTSKLDNYGKLHVLRAVGNVAETTYKYSIYSR